jgi:uncharacterized protein YcbX
MTLTGIFVYPIKSLAGITLESSKVGERGLSYDRRWTLVDKDFRFLSQRDFPKMALFKPEIKEDHILVRFKDSKIHIPFEESFYKKTARVTIWDDTLDSLIASPDINKWFSKELGTDCQLAYQGSASVRLTPSQYAPSQEVSFADGYPYLLISESSLELLNDKLDSHVPMNRFRPNLVVRGLPAHHEDQYEDIKIGSVNFRAVKPCARCQITTIDQSNPSFGKEPLKTLATYRRKGNKILFGQNLILNTNKEQLIRIGDEVEVWNPKPKVQLKE